MAGGTCCKHGHYFLIATVFSYAWLKGGGVVFSVALSLRSAKPYTQTAWRPPHDLLGNQTDGRITHFSTCHEMPLRIPPAHIHFFSLPLLRLRRQDGQTDTEAHIHPQGHHYIRHKTVAESNGAVGLPGSGQAPLSYIEMEAMGKL